MKNNLDNANDKLNKLEQSRNSKHSRFKSNDASLQMHSRNKRSRQRDFSGPLPKESPLAKFKNEGKGSKGIHLAQLQNSKVKHPTRRNSKTGKDSSRHDRASQRSSRGTKNWNQEMPKFMVPNIGNLAKSTNFNRNALKGSFSSSKGESGLQKMLNNFTLGKKAKLNKKGRNGPPELTNISNIRRSYDSRNARTNSEVSAPLLSYEIPPLFYTSPL